MLQENITFEEKEHNNYNVCHNWWADYYMAIFIHTKGLKKYHFIHLTVKYFVTIMQTENFLSGNCNLYNKFKVLA
jgi:hypothetical protein